MRLEERHKGTGSQPSEEVALSLEEMSLSRDTRGQLWECGKSLGTPQLLPGKALAHDKTSQTSLPCLLLSLWPNRRQPTRQDPSVGSLDPASQGRGKKSWSDAETQQLIKWHSYLTLRLLNEN